MAAPLALPARGGGAWSSIAAAISVPLHSWTGQGRRRLRARHVRSLTLIDTARTLATLIALAQYDTRGGVNAALKRIPIILKHSLHA